MRLSDGSTIADWGKKSPGATKRARDLSGLAAVLDDIKSVVDALPNSREELEGIVVQAKAVLADARLALAAVEAELTARVSSEMSTAVGTVRREGQRVLDDVDELRRELDSAVAKIESWEPPEAPDVSGFAELAALDAVQQGLAGQVSSVVGDLSVLREESRQALKAFKENVEHRFKGVMTVAPPASAIKVKKSGTKVGERKAINFIPGSNVSLTVADNGAGEGQVDVTIASTASGSGGHTIREDGTDLTARTGLNFTAGLTASDDSAGDETEVTIAAGGVTNDMLAGSIANTKLATDPLARANHTGTQGSTTISGVATDRLLGRDAAGSGAAEELTVGGGVEFTGSGGIQTSALTGDVTKAAGGTATTIAAGAVTNAMLAGSIALSKLATDPLARANHTGTQLAATISDFAAAVRALAPAAVHKSATESVTSSTALQNDDALAFAVGANETNLALLVLLVSGNASGDFKFGFSVPAGATGFFAPLNSVTLGFAPGDTTSDALDTRVESSFPGAAFLGLGTTQVALLIAVKVTTAGTAGTVNLQWAQGTSDATATNVHAGSFLLPLEVA